MVSSALGKALGLTEESTLEELKNGIVGVKDYTYSLQEALWTADDKTKSAMRMQDGYIDIAPAVGYWGNWDWTVSGIRVPITTLSDTRDNILLFQWAQYSSSGAGSNEQLNIIPYGTSVTTGNVYIANNAIYFAKSFSKVVLTFHIIIGGGGKGGYYVNYNYNGNGWAGFSSYTQTSTSSLSATWYIDAGTTSLTFTNVNAGEYVAFMSSRDSRTYGAMVAASTSIQCL